MNTCKACRYYMTSPLEEPCESCHWDGVIGQAPTNWEALTNADRIRAMTNEEMAEWLSHAWHKSWYTLQEWLDWLKSPVEVDNG